MKIKILGNGGAINDGLPYNSFIIDDKFLVETPPDIMNSLYRENVSIDSIESVYISHLHGDHTFGFPFLALRLFFNFKRDGIERFLTVYIPSGGTEYLKSLIESALSKDHPCMEWVMNSFEFINTSDCLEFHALNSTFSLYRMEHSIETYGFIINSSERPLFAYTADTLWCRSVSDMISSGPEAVLVDMNGEPDDPTPKHISEKDIIDNAPPLLKTGTVLYGTHLKKNKNSPIEFIKYAAPGFVINTGL